MVPSGTDQSEEGQHDEVRSVANLGAVLLAGLLLSGCDAGGAGQVEGVDPPSTGGTGPVEEGLPAAAVSALAEEPVSWLTEEQVERCLEAVMEDFDAAGVSVAVIQQGEPGACAAWGWSGCGGF